ncbi:MAG: cupin domain-containing protein [Alphaproteobacteria bacterium]|nr:cupin domain-containing protein [Alphaproteobacteria bacterium]
MTDAPKTVAFKERLKGRLQPTPGGSVYVDPEDMEWTKSQFDKIWMKVLYRNDAEGEMTVLLKWEPGAVLPFHKHPEIEQSFVLEGSFYDHDGVCRAGQYVYRHPGSMHQTRSDEGCLLLAVYRKPNIFFKSAGFEAENADR